MKLYSHFLQDSIKQSYDNLNQLGIEITQIYNFQTINNKLCIFSKNLQDISINKYIEKIHDKDKIILSLSHKILNFLHRYNITLNDIANVSNYVFDVVHTINIKHYQCFSILENYYQNIKNQSYKFKLFSNNLDYIDLFEHLIKKNSYVFLTKLICFYLNHDIMDCDLETIFMFLVEYVKQIINDQNRLNTCGDFILQSSICSYFGLFDKLSDFPINSLITLNTKNLYSVPKTYKNVNIFYINENTIQYPEYIMDIDQELSTLDKFFVHKINIEHNLDDNIQKKMYDIRHILHGKNFYEFNTQPFSNISGLLLSNPLSNESKYLRDNFFDFFVSINTLGKDSLFQFGTLFFNKTQADKPYYQSNLFLNIWQTNDHINKSYVDGLFMQILLNVMWKQPKILIKNDILKYKSINIPSYIFEIYDLDNLVLRFGQIQFKRKMTLLDCNLVETNIKKSYKSNLDHHDTLIITENSFYNMIEKLLLLDKKKSYVFLDFYNNGKIYKLSLGVFSDVN